MHTKNLQEDDRAKDKKKYELKKNKNSRNILEENQVTQTWDKSRINQAGLRLLYTVLQYAMSEDGAGIFTEFWVKIWLRMLDIMHMSFTQKRQKKKDILKYARTQDKLTHEVLQKELFDDESQQTKGWYKLSIQKQRSQEESGGTESI